MSTQYFPVPPNQAIEAKDYVYSELQDLTRALSEAQEVSWLQSLAAAPDKPREGMVVHADGTNWDPGSGAGPYSYIGGTWTSLFTGGAGGGQSSIQFKDEGTNLGTVGTVTSVDFVGAGVTATRVTNALTVTIAGGGMSDGDKGDITVGSSGTTLTIDNDAVTYAKIQNVSATDKVLGRVTIGAGDIEEISCTAAGRDLLDDATAADQRTTLGLVIGTNVAAQTHASQHKLAGSDAIRLDELALPTASVSFNDQQATSFRLENRTSDPGTPTTGQIWLRTDL